MSEKKEIKLRQCELVTNLEYIDLEQVKAKLMDLTKNGKSVTEYAFIIHDKDTYDQSGKKADGTSYNEGDLKTPHIHLMMKFKSPVRLHCIANWFNVIENNINKIKSKWVSALRYLTHSNHPEKHQYDDSEVISNFDYSEEKDNFKVSNRGGSARKDEILNNVSQGHWKMLDLYNPTNITELEFVKYSADITKALNYRQTFLQLNEKGRNMDVIYISGGSGSGKTTLAREYAEKKGHSIYVSDGGKNPMDNYMGQDCIILDDFRPDVMGLSDLLKLLDNHTSSMVNARYYNKYMGECKLLIITTIEDLPDFFSKIPNANGEPIKQLERRCKTKMIVDTDSVGFYSYIEDEYQFSGSIPNPIKDRSFAQKPTVDVNDFAQAFGLSDQISTTNVINF
ncbi:Rep family protein [Vibrio hibernica]|uniref:Rep family protein n=1 Tax=Vibrio hibernica TaxID=2587465 RepID=UPI0039AEA09C